MEKISEYTLNITTKEGETYTVTGPQFHLTYVDDNGVDQLLMESETTGVDSPCVPGR